MPPKIIDASKIESTQPKPAIQWYPLIPSSKAMNKRPQIIPNDPASLLMKTDRGASFSCLCSNTQEMLVVSC